MRHVNAPPPVLDGARVLSYAIADETVTYTGKTCFIERGRVLQPAKFFAICQQLGDEDVLYFYCTSDWYVLGGAFCPSVDEAKAYIEHGYRGISKKWVDVNVSEADARAFLERDIGELPCSFCGLVPGEDDDLEVGPTAAICSKCFDKTYALFEAEGLV